MPSVLLTEVHDLGPRSGRLIIFQNSRNGSHERVAARSQFVQPVWHDLLQSALASGKQDYGNLPLVAAAAIAPHVTVCFKTIDQTHRAVMPNKKAFGQLSDAGLLPVRESAEGKKHLVLLRFKAGGFRRIVATPEKLTDAIAQFSQCRVFGIANSPSHVLIVSDCDINANRHSFEASWSDICASN